MRAALRNAGPALLAYTLVRASGLAVLGCWSWVAGRDAHHLLVSWDAQWYRDIAGNGYGFVRVHEDGRLLSDYAFFPMLPGLEWLVSGVTGLRLVDSGLLVSATASLLAAWGIFAIGDHLHDRSTGVVLVVAWAALPVGIVASMAYSEALFTAFAAWSTYSVITKHWIWAGALASMAGLTRPVGVAVVAAVVVPAVVVLLRRSPPDPEAEGADPATWRVAVGALVAPLGWVGYVGWVGWRTGSPLGYFDVAGRWGNGFDAGIDFAQWVWGFLGSPAFLLGALVCVGVALVGWLLVLCVRQRLPLTLLVFCGVLVFLAFTTSGYFGSKPRYLLPAFPLLIPVAAALSRVRFRRRAPALVLMTAASALYGAFWLHGPGPP